MTTLYKAVRPDGTDFYTGTIQWAPPADHEGDWIVRHPDGEREPGTHPSTFLSVATTPTDCTGMEWPCRLLTVEPVDGYLTACPNREIISHRVAATAWRVTGERPAHEVFGPQGEHVARFIDDLAGAARGIVRAAKDVAWYATGHAIRDAAGEAAWYAATDAAWYAAEDAIRGAAWDAVWDAKEEAWDAASDAAWVAARGTVKEVDWYSNCGAALDAVAAATTALVVRDLIPRETYDVLTRPVRLAGITVHPDDPDLTKED